MNNRDLTEEDIERIRTGKLSQSEKKKLEQAIVENEPALGELALRLALRKQLQIDLETEANEYAKKFKNVDSIPFSRKLLWRSILFIIIIICIIIGVLFQKSFGETHSQKNGAELIQAMIAEDPTFFTLGDTDWRALLKGNNPNWDEARKVIEAEILIEDSNCVDGARQFYLGLIYLKIDASPKQAIPYLECAHKLEVAPDKTPNFLLESYLRTGQIETAKIFYKEHILLIDLALFSVEDLKQLNLDN